MNFLKNWLNRAKARGIYLTFYVAILSFVFAYGTNCNNTTPFNYVKDISSQKIASEDFIFETINDAEAGIKQMSEYPGDSYLSTLSPNMARSLDKIKNLIFDLQLPTNSNDVLKLYTKLVDSLSKMRDRINFLVLQGQIDVIFGNLKNLQGQVDRINNEVIPALEKRMISYVDNADKMLQKDIDLTGKQLELVEAQGKAALADHIKNYMADKTQMQADIKAAKERADYGVRLAESAINMYQQLNGVVAQQGSEMKSFKGSYDVFVAAVSKNTEENNKIVNAINGELAALKNASNSSYDAAMKDWKCTEDLDTRNGIELMLGQRAANFNEFVNAYQTNVSEACTRSKELMLYNMCALQYPTFCGECLDANGTPVPPNSCASWMNKTASERLNILINLRQDIAIHFLNQRTEVQGLAIWGGKDCNASCLEAPEGVSDNMIKSLVGDLNASSGSTSVCTEDSWKACGLFGATYALALRDAQLDQKINGVQANLAAQIDSLRTDFENEKVRAAQALNMTKQDLEAKISTLDDKTKDRLGAITNALGGKITSIAGADQSFADELDAASKTLYAVQASYVSLRETAFPTSLTPLVGFKTKSADEINAIFMQDRDALVDILANLPALLNDVDREFMKALITSNLADQNNLPFFDASMASALGTTCGAITKSPFNRVIGRDSFRLLGIAYIKELINGVRSTSDSNNRIFFSGQTDRSDMVGSAILSQALTAYMLSYDAVEANPSAACLSAIDAWAKAELLDNSSSNNSALRTAISNSLTLPRAVESLRISYDGLKNRVNAIEMKVRAMAVSDTQVPEAEATLTTQINKLAFLLAKAGRDKFSSDVARRRFDSLTELARSLSPQTDSWQMEFNTALRQVNTNLTSYYQDVTSLKTNMSNIIPYVAFAANADSRVAGSTILAKVNAAKATLDASILAQVNAAVATANYTPEVTSIRHILPNYAGYNLGTGAVASSCTSNMNDVVFSESKSAGYIQGSYLCWVNMRNGSMEANKHNMILRVWGSANRFIVKPAGANNCAASNDSVYRLDVATVTTPTSQNDLLSPQSHRMIYASKVDAAGPKGRYDLQVPKLFDAYYYGGACMEQTNWNRASFFTVTPVRVDGNGGEVLGTAVGYRSTLYSPIVLDFVNKGMIETLAQDSEVKFDLTGDGQPTHTGWVSGRQGAFLGIDLNNNGHIDDGRELFGQFTQLPNGRLAKNGYEALAQYDVNKDGVIDNKDPAYHNLLVWFDNNVNGVSEPFEMKTLAEMDVTKIAVNYKEVPAKNQINNGNMVKYQAKFFGPRQCGKKGCNSYDIFFETGRLVEVPNLAKQ
ncbi:MAG: hypothetical protein RJB66_1822 [Pseudomonadota bacterium]|jgi:hypothetical protein